jgi:hypothetical protein
LELVVNTHQFGWEEHPDAEDVTIFVVPTALRIIFIEDIEIPDFEFEGWVLGHAGKPWVRGVLRTGKDGEIIECGIYVLEPGQEIGTERTPGIE